MHFWNLFYSRVSPLRRSPFHSGKGVRTHFRPGKTLRVPGVEQGNSRAAELASLGQSTLCFQSFPLNPATPKAKPPTLFLRAFFCLTLSFLGDMTALTHAEPPSGVKTLHTWSRSDGRSLIRDRSIRPLLTAEEQEAYLAELEKQPPRWETLHDPPGEEHGTRLFELNRQRDAQRESHPLLAQRIAFWWGAELGEYLPDRQGFKLAIGPELTQTSWGIVRFKPIGLPNEMIALPSTDIVSSLRTRLSTGEKVQVGILFSGRLVPWESIIYGFSHDGLGQGMVMPVVEIDQVQYFFSVLP